LPTRLATHLADADADAVGAEVAKAEDAATVGCSSRSFVVTSFSRNLGWWHFESRGQHTLSLHPSDAAAFEKKGRISH